VQFFDDVIAWVKRGCWFHRQRRGGRLSVFEQLAEKQWLREELLRLEECELKYAKALTLQQRLLNNSDDWLVFLDNERVDPTNNLAERALRPLVVLRKSPRRPQPRGCTARGHDAAADRNVAASRPFDAGLSVRTSNAECGTRVALVVRQLVVSTMMRAGGRAARLATPADRVPGAPLAAASVPG